VRVIRVAPTACGRQGLFGGGERYPLELAGALAQHVSCELITFGSETATHRDRRADSAPWRLGGRRGR